MPQQMMETKRTKISFIADCKKSSEMYPEKDITIVKESFTSDIIVKASFICVQTALTNKLIVGVQNWPDTS